MARWLLALTALLIWAAALADQAPAAAQTSRSATWERFDVTIDLLSDGTLRVLERQQVRFDGTFQRGFRDVPFQRLTSITEVQVSEGGQPYRSGYNQPGSFSSTRQDDMLRIEWWFPPTTNASRTFEVSYRVSGAVRIYEGGDQLWWKAVPAGLGGAVRASEVVVRLPVAVSPELLKGEAYLGGDSERPASLAAGEVRFATSNIAPGQELEVRVQFPHGLVAAAKPSWQEADDRNRALGPILDLLSVLAAVLILVGGPLAIYLRWYWRGRDPAIKPLASSITEPPSALPPGLVGTLVDERVDLQDALATLLDLGKRGVIRITQVRNGALEASGLDYELELLQPRPLGLHGYESTLIGALFGGDSGVRLSQVKQRWGRAVRLFEKQLYGEAVRTGLFVADPQRVRSHWRKGGAAAIVAGFLAMIVLRPQLVAPGLANLVWLPSFGLIVVGILAIAASSVMPRRTKTGVIEAQRWKAFAKYLAVPQRLGEKAGTDSSAGLESGAAEEADIARRKPAEVSYLPYAVALGVDGTCLRRLADVGSAPGHDEPVVIVGPGGWYSAGHSPTYTVGQDSGYSAGAGRGGSAGAAAPDSGWLEGRGEGAAGALNTAGDWLAGRTSNLDAASSALSGLLNAASDALSAGVSGGAGGGGSGGGGWSGGGGNGGGGGGSGGGGGGAD